MPRIKLQSIADMFRTERRRSRRGEKKMMDSFFHDTTLFQVSAIKTFKNDKFQDFYRRTITIKNSDGDHIRINLFAIDPGILKTSEEKDMDYAWNR